MPPSKPRTGTMLDGADPARPATSPDSHRGALPVDLPAELATHPRYVIIRQLGQGGMGVVYQARHRVMERQVAIKVISKSVLDKPEALARFHSEVKAAARLQHPNIVAAYDAEQAGSLHMLVMEYVEGADLGKVLEKKGPLPVAHSCHYIRQAALGLEHAFEQGMTHRDIKPQNLMLTPKGQVKILDFGLARLASEHKRGAGLTQDGAFMGTPEYMAPEQATDARTADIRSDIYSLGCTLYTLLAGRLPFNEDTVVKIVLAHLEKEPQPLTELRPDVPPDLSRVVAQMLAKNPDDRFQTPAAVARALSPFCKASPAESQQPAPERLKSEFAQGRGTEIPGDTSPLGAQSEPLIVKRSPASRAPAEARKAGSAVPRVSSEVREPPVPARPAQRRFWILTTAAVAFTFVAGLIGLWASGILSGNRKAPRAEVEPAPALAKVEERPVLPASEERPASRKPPAPAENVPLRLTKISALFLEANQTLTVPVRVERGSCKGPIVLALEALPEGVNGRASIIPRGSSGGEFEIFVGKAAANAVASVRLLAKGTESSSEAQVRLALGTAKPAAERLKEYTEATQIHPEDATTWLNRGHTYKQLGNQEKALDDFNQAIRVRAGDALAHLHRGMLLVDKKLYDNALADFNEAARLLPNDKWLHYSRGLCYCQKRQYERALRELDDALAVDARFALACFEKGNVHADLRRPERAVADYDRAIEIEPEMAHAYARRGQLHHQMKDDKKALADFDRALDLEPKDPLSLNARASIYLERQLYDRAERDLERALAIDPKFTQAYDNRGVVLTFKREYDRALKDLDRALDLDEKSAVAHYHRGLVNHEKDRYNNAIKDFTRAIELDPQFADAYRGRAQSLDALGKNSRRSKSDRDRAKLIDKKK